MGSRAIAAVLLVLPGMAPSLPALAQDTFYGHVGASYGRARLDADCLGVGGECDRRYLRADDFRRGGGDTDLQLVNLGRLAGIPFGLNGAQMGVTKNWAVRLDLDRYRPKFPGNTGRENLDTLMLGVQYSFGGGG